MRLILLTLLCIFSLLSPSLVHAQTLTTLPQSEMEVCREAQPFQVLLINDSSATLSNVQFTIALPQGIQYVANSVVESTSLNVQEQDVSQNSGLVFSANNLPVGDSVKFTIQVAAYQEAIPYQNTGALFRNQTTVTYTGGSQTDESDAYNILYPALTILSVAPNAQTLLSGNSITRDISVINGGNGKTETVYITDVRNSGLLTLDATSLGTISGDTIILTGADFAGIGNGDNYFDQNESFTLTQTLSGTSCSDITVTSAIRAWWGCSGTLTPTATSYGNVSIDFQTPNLKLLSTQTLESCFGAGMASQQQLRVVNKGSGIASGVQLSIFKSTGGGYNQNIFSRLDASSLQYKIGASGSWASVSGVTTTATQNAGDYSCLGSNPIGRVDFTLADLQPGDTVFVAWDMYSCCIQTCEDDAVKGWKATAAYTDICGTASYNTDHTGQGRNNQQISFTTETPTDIINGQEEDYTFIVSSFKNTLPVGTGANYKVTFTLDAGLVYEDMRFHSNGVEWSPLSVNYSGNTVVALFPSTAPFTVPKSEINLTLSGNCGTSGWKTIELDMAYVPDTTCTTVCEIPIECDHQVTTYLHCPLGPCDGPSVLSFAAVRTNFGAPDNNLDGLADGSGALNMNEVKVNRAMVGDTIRGSVAAVIESTGGSWSYGAFTSSVDYGSVLAVIGSELVIYDSSADTTYTLTGLTYSTSTNSNQRDFTFDLDVASLAAIDASLTGYAYGQGDSVELHVDYEVTGSVAGLLKECTFLNEFYLSTVANPGNGQKDFCNFKNGRITLIGYGWRNNSAGNATVNSCTKVVNQYFGMSIGDMSSNYGGGNLFPYEARQWGHLKEAWLVIPPNYSHVNTVIRQWRTRRTNATTSQTVSSVSPDAVNGDTLYFNVDQYYAASQFAKSDDGFHGRFQVELAPTCDVPENTYQDLVWIFNYQKSEKIDAAESGQVFAGSNDRIRYQRSTLQPLSNNPWQDANTREVVWDYKLKNASGSDADHAWIRLVPPPNFTIDSVVNDANGQALTVQNDLYLVGTVGANSTADFSIYGNFSNCDTVLMETYAGYECTGYPDDFASFSCPYEYYVLYVEPKPAAYQTRISTELAEDPCSPELDVVVDITSVKTAHMFDMSIDFITADTNKIKVKDGTSEFQYNISSAYASVADPGYSSNNYSYDINNYDPSFEMNGIPGVLDINNNRYRLKSTLELGDQFVNGDFLQIQINGANACDVQLPTINLAVDPSISFEKDQSAGLHTDVIDSWSASWGDYDNDGYDDLFVPSKDVNATNILYHNNQDGTFSKVTSGPIVEDLGAAVSGSWGDYDNDGDLDLFVAYVANAPNRLYRNNGDGTFTNVEGLSITNEGIYSHSVAWADYNKDGNLDLVMTNFHPTHFNFLYAGDGAGGFTADQSSVIAQSATSAVGVAWGDYDNDGDADLFIANTNGENNQLFRNDAGAFTEITSGEVVNDGGHSVGGTWGDYDSDGDLDLFVTNSTNTEPNFLYTNNGDGTFQRVTTGAVATDQSNSHGASWIDYDNDGDLDLTVANDQGSKNYLYSNNGNGTFTKLANAITDDKRNSYGVAWSDFDNDGDYDLYVANKGNSTNEFFINGKGSCTNHIGVNLVGCMSNRDGIGATIRVKATINGTSLWQTKHVSTQTSGMAGQNSNKLLFGLRDANSVDSLVVEWPSGVVTRIANPVINQIHLINEDCASKVCGVLFNDQDEDGVQGPGEKGIPNYSLTVAPGGFKVYTDDNGYYQFYAADGSYSISVDTSSNWSQTFPVGGGTQNLVVDQNITAEYCGNDFGLNSTCDDPDLEVSLGTTAFRRGLTNQFNVVVSNRGAYDATDDIEVVLTMTENVYIMDEDWLEQSAPPGYLKYSKTFSGLEQLSDTLFELTDSVALSASLDELVTVDAEIFYEEAECDTGNNTFSMTDVVVGSVDPNDKAVLVQEVGLAEVAYRNEILVYKIRFQNVGNYAARIVRIEDELSPDLDWSTFQPESSSHPFTVSIVDGVVQWVNRNIELPDSASDPEGSQGYVTFTIQPRKDLDIYTRIDNDARIQFDYNEFIVTNNTTIYVKPVDFEVVKPTVTVFPNPAVDQLNVVLVDPDKQLMEIQHIEILDMNGTPVLQEFGVRSLKHLMELGNLRRGVYIVQVYHEGARFTTRLIVT